MNEFIQLSDRSSINLNAVERAELRYKNKPFIISKLVINDDFDYDAIGIRLFFSSGERITYTGIDADKIKYKLRFYDYLSNAALTRLEMEKNR